MKEIVIILLVLGCGLLFLVPGNTRCTKFVSDRGMSNAMFDLMLWQLNGSTTF